MTALDTRPSADEHAAFALTYVDATEAALRAAEDSGVVSLLSGQWGALRALVGSVDDTTLHSGYAPDKWTLAESLLHAEQGQKNSLNQKVTRIPPNCTPHVHFKFRKSKVYPTIRHGKS